MVWRFEPGEPLSSAFRRVAEEECARIEAGLRSGDDPEAAIHQARQGFKRLRALLRLARHSLGDDFKAEDRRWSDAGQLLAQSRHQTVMRQTFDRVAAKCPDLPSAEIAALRAAIGDGGPEPASPSATDRRKVLASVRAGKRRLASLDWPQTSEELGEGVKAGASRLRKRWRKARRAPGSKELHALRKRVKDHASQIRLFRGIAPEIVEERREASKAIAELLGDERDLGLLAGALSEASIPDVSEKTREALLKHIAKRRKVLWRRSCKAAEPCFEQSPRALASSLAAAWAGATADTTAEKPPAPPRRTGRNATSRSR